MMLIPTMSRGCGHEVDMGVHLLVVRLDRLSDQAL
jgi:hypothetical protein